MSITYAVKKSAGNAVFSSCLVSAVCVVYRNGRDYLNQLFAISVMEQDDEGERGGRSWNGADALAPQGQAQAGATAVLWIGADALGMI